MGQEQGQQAAGSTGEYEFGPRKGPMRKPVFMMVHLMFDARR